MSYEQIKSINIDIKNKKVFITSASSSCVPKKYIRWHVEGFDRYFEDWGVEAIKKDILFQFFSGYFKGDSTHYGKCMQSFIDKYNGDGDLKFQDYLKYKDGDNEFREAFLNKLYEHYLEYERKRKSEELFIIKIRSSSYILKLKQSRAMTTAITTDIKTKAKTFNLGEAEDIKQRFLYAGAEMIKVKN